MRPLTDEETKSFFEKLAKYIGRNIRFLIDNENEEYCFRLQKDRVYYVRLSIAEQATTIGRDNLLTLGTCFGKFTKTGKFKLHITALPYLAQYCSCKIWVKAEAETSFLYGNHLVKNGISKITDNMARNIGCVMFNENDIAIGFGTTACSSVEYSRLSATGIVCYNQGDLGEYLREEDTMMVQN
ncbi:60S ribosome subunit Biogenesis protein NIP7, putative [Entamoeba dispar SAW760]|uniref:60S ribosome subunit biogenesis protein NIP7 homolog n=1 Tax=Entamoeba dispar (strain ATCC PRA-260 / SAW760) TaxID=370354 RepID=B0E5D1_ENTDS|nr:60S ribosome subunit Biogenesis protein NIP7, putative [Entamoeba dispar SAW760]XP_001735446.1 60S ribosome subunit Biogenesis protein NIP7, putative [Entamoeba dispar SAW760]XP_001739143.1 60S ribosome subunit Biogenesis protein NIP7, putative [Entamoeba dispar SAW760]EDR24486.1 60S ribosome subunit Biogenesis protein NIP7, putative [Entamoeba dispar SAW760]EDR28351.1 60S ribosome subunit Biogenesis protein NIP7, putative [Entamoeba dispar SAW760]EDR30264.1 60S ribosome subunit Biogenesis |eukprot:EDR24486.1 60S ribosome subunit Biogenesis protein NIP7, putative [Entamoeba dispar SAW760]